MVDVQHLTCGYGEKTVLQDVSFHVRRGEKLCVIGANGCGKTTLLRAMTNLLPYQGSVKMLGNEVCRLNTRMLAMLSAFVMQHETSFFPYTVYESVAFGRYPHLRGSFSAFSDADEAAVQEALAVTGLTELQQVMTDCISGGQLQRVSLARAFAQQPHVILLDEPTNHLDLKYQIELLDYLNDWVRRGDRCVIGVLHDLNLVRQFADRVVLMHASRVFACGTPAEVLTEQNLLTCFGTNIRQFMLNALRQWE